ncbi:phage tail protein [Vreelandella sp. V005]|uniref:phage tail protein n=1 Tax=Vreelandella sp. V005 TaxID=3459608 RepID=UPI004044E2A9
MIDENSTFGGFLTTIGEAKQSNANALQIPWKLTHLLLGDANGNDPVPAPGQAQLVNQVHRAAINQLSVDPDNPAILVAEVVLPPDIGGWWIRELGIEDVDGDFVAVANCPPSYKPLLAQGSGRNQVVRMHLILSNTANVQLKIDPSVVLATREYVDTQRTEHEASRNHPEATEAEQGMARVADQTMVNTGANDVRFVTPKKLKAWATQWVKQATETVAGMLKVATQAQVDAGEDDTTAVTPKKLRWGFSYSFGQVGYIFLPSWMGGFVMQWGKYTSSSVGKIPGNFPVAFPNQYFGSVGTFFGGFSGIDTANVKVEANTLTSFNFATVNQNGAFSNSPLFLIHLGY